MEPGSILDSALERVPLVDHVGKSGATLERVLLADGRRVVVKRFTPATDLVMSLTGDLVGREYQLWSRGVLDQLPAGVRHAVVDGWAEPGGSVLVMRDLGRSVLTWEHRLSADRCRWMVERLARLHRRFLQDSPADLTPLPALLGLFAPQRLVPHAADDNPLAAIALHGWDIFADMVDPETADRVFSLLRDPAPLVEALTARPTTLIHGDMATVNMAFEGDDLTLLDWSMPAAAPGSIDLARFIAGCSSVVDMTREDLLAEYRLAAGPAYDEPALRLAMVSGLVWLGWNKALDAAEHPVTAVRERERRDLEWWVAEASRTLDAGML